MSRWDAPENGGDLGGAFSLAHYGAGGAANHVRAYAGPSSQEPGLCVVVIAADGSNCGGLAMVFREQASLPPAEIYAHREFGEPLVSARTHSGIGCLADVPAVDQRWNASVDEAGTLTLGYPAPASAANSASAPGAGVPALPPCTTVVLPFGRAQGTEAIGVGGGASCAQATAVITQYNAFERAHQCNVGIPCPATIGDGWSCDDVLSDTQRVRYLCRNGRAVAVGYDAP